MPTECDTRRVDEAPVSRYFTSPDGTRLSYIDEGDGPAVVLLHGLTANWHANWVEPDVIEPLVRAGYRAIALDARGHGQSEAPAADGAYRPEVLAADVAALVRYLDLEPISLVGYSYGSVTTALLAAAGDIKLTSVVLGGVAMGSLRPIDSGPATDAVAAALAVDDPSTIGDEGLIAMRKRMEDWNARPLAISAIYGALRELAPIDVAAINVPVLVINSPMEPHDVAPSVPGARSVIVEGDHLSAPNDPAFTEAIIAFLKETNPV